MPTSSIDILGIPDFDQRRQGLPNNGQMYCAPTSSFNNIYFMGTHGFPELLISPLDPGNSVLQMQPHAGITLRLLELGLLDGTDPFLGGGMAGTPIYISSRSVNPFTVYTFYKSSPFPNPSLAADWLKLGGLVSLCFGRYTFPNSTLKGRDGGHCITMTGLTAKWSSASPANSYFGGDTNYRLRYRDPATDEGMGNPNQLTQQSNAATTEWDLYPEYATFDGTTCTLYGIGPKPSPNPNDPNWWWKARYAYIDGYQIVVPLFGMSGVSKKFGSAVSATASPQAVSDAPPLRLLMSAAFDSERGYGRADSVDFTSLVPAGTVDVVFDRIQPTIVLASEDQQELVEVNLAHRTRRTLARLPGAPQRLAAGGADGNVYVLMPGLLGKVDRGGELRTVRVDQAIEAISFDDKRREIVAASDAHLFFFNEQLHSRPEMEAPLGGPGKLTLQIDSTADQVLALRAGDTSIRRVSLDASGNGIRQLSRGPDLVLTDARHPITFTLGPRGRVFVNDGGTLREYDREGSMNRTSRFDGMAVGDILAFPRDIDNSVEAGVRGPNWRNLPPEETAPQSG